MDIERVKTYVEGLDDVMGGGVPKGHVVLVSGLPGTMKSSLTYAILHGNALADVPGLYVSLEQTKESLEMQMRGMGFAAEDRAKGVAIADVAAIRKDVAKGKSTAWLEFLRRTLDTRKKIGTFDLLTIDSLEALEVLAKFKDHRREIYRLFEWLRDLGVTSFLITERPDWVIAGHVIQGRWDEDFLADGVFHLRQHLVTDLEVQRRLRVVKMRGTKHESGYLALVLDEGRFKVTRAMSP